MPCWTLAPPSLSTTQAKEERKNPEFHFVLTLSNTDKSARSNRAAAFNLIGDFKHAAQVTVAFDEKMRVFKNGFFQDCIEELSRIQLAADEVALPYLNKHLGVA